MKVLYDINGTQLDIGGGLSNAQVKSALLKAVADGDVNLGAVVGASIAYTSPGETWEANGVVAYNNLCTAYKITNNTGIPFFISTDQHSGGVEQHRWLNNLDSDANGMNVISINLGDTVLNTFSIAQLKAHYERTWQIKNYISVAGNHEYAMGGEIPTYHDIKRYFGATKDERYNTAEQNCFVVVDDYHNVKWVCVENYILDDNGNMTRGLTTSAAEWLIEELSKNDGYDIAYLQHWPSYRTCMARGGSAESASLGSAPENQHPSVEQYKMWQLLLARKNRQSGTFTDSDGIAHTFDFKDCENELLIALYGHEHAEWITTQDGLTAYAADWYGNNKTCTFGLIDRANSKVTFWVFNATGCLDPLELPI